MATSSLNVLRVPRRFVEHMFDHAREGWPEEICGLIAGKHGKPIHAYRVTNGDDNRRTRYNMDASELFRAHKDMENRGWELYGIYHSHPASQAMPSETDRRMALDSDAPRGEQARYPGVIYFIVSLQDREHPHVRAWRLYEETNVEEVIEVVDTTGNVEGD